MATVGRLRMETREAGQVLVVDLAGDVTLGQESIALRDLLRARLDEDRKAILVNFAAVKYMDSTGIGVLVEAKSHAMTKGAQIRLCNLPPFVDKVLRRVNLHTVLQVYGTENEALENFG